MKYNNRTVVRSDSRRKQCSHEAGGPDWNERATRLIRAHWWHRQKGRRCYSVQLVLVEFAWSCEAIDVAQKRLPRGVLFLLSQLDPCFQPVVSQEGPTLHLDKSRINIEIQQVRYPTERCKRTPSMFLQIDGLKRHWGSKCVNHVTRKTLCALRNFTYTLWCVIHHELPMASSVVATTPSGSCNTTSGS